MCAIGAIMIAQTHFSSLKHAHVIGYEVVSFQLQWPGGSTSSEWAYYQKALVLLVRGRAAHGR